MLQFIIMLSAFAAGVVLLRFVSGAFAFELSRVFEAACDWIEFRLERREQRRSAGAARANSVTEATASLVQAKFSL